MGRRGRLTAADRQDRTGQVCQGMSVCMYDTDTCVNVSVFVRVCLYVCMH